MAVFDLKHARIFIREGSSSTGAVNNVAGYAIGTVTMAVDGFTSAPPVGSVFRLAAGKTEYTITASTTTSVTFKPGLLAAAVDNDPIHVAGIQVEAKLGDGTLSYDENKAREYITNRGLLDEVRDGPQEPVSINLDAQIQFYTGDVGDPGGGLPTIADMLTQTGLASSWVTSDPSDPCRPYCVDIKIVYNPVCPTVDGEYIYFSQFRYEKLAGDFKAGKFTVTGKCNILRPTSERFAQLGP